jgi:ribonuclease Z
MDHFAGFDLLLRVCLHRTGPLYLFGPAEFADRVEHKLRAYTLNLLDEDSVDFVIVVSEFGGKGFGRVCEFRAREAFRRHEIPPESPMSTAPSNGRRTTYYAANRGFVIRRCH